MTTKTTSLDKVRAALNEHGWRYETNQTTVRVPDHDSDKVVRRSGRVRYAPTKAVDAVSVRFTNNAGGDFDHWVAKTATLVFLAESGSYLRGESKGNHDFVDRSLKTVLANIERFSPAATKARLEARAAEEQADDEKEQHEVAVAYAAALEEERIAATALVKELAALGLSEQQVAAVTDMVEAKEGPIQKFTAAKVQRERIGTGWLPGKSYLNGIYEDGKRVK